MPTVEDLSMKTDCEYHRRGSNQMIKQLCFGSTLVNHGRGSVAMTRPAWDCQCMKDWPEPRAMARARARTRTRGHYGQAPVVSPRDFRRLAAVSQISLCAIGMARELLQSEERRRRRPRRRLQADA